MNTLYVLNETFTNGFRSEILDIISKNPIVSVLFLIGLFLSIASYLMILGLNFIGLSYLLVYVGAVSILFLFILMLINVRVSELTGNPSNSIPLAIFICLSFSYPVNQILPHSIASFNSSIFNFNTTLSNLLDNKFNFLYNLFNSNGVELD